MNMGKKRKKFRMFNKKKYRYAGDHKHSAANNYAKGLRKNGFHARVVKRDKQYSSVYKGPLKKN